MPQVVSAAHELPGTMADPCASLAYNEYCEMKILANGTNIAFPLVAKCMELDGNACGLLSLANGTVIQNPNIALVVEEEQGEAEDNDNDNYSNDNNNDDEAAADDEDLPEDGGCQGSDDYCDADEGCRSESVDCIDDRNFDEEDYNG